MLVDFTQSSLCHVPQMFHWPNQIQKIKYLNKSYTLKLEFKIEATIVNQVHLTTY